MHFLGEVYRLWKSFRQISHWPPWVTKVLYWEATNRDSPPFQNCYAQTSDAINLRFRIHVVPDRVVASSQLGRRPSSTSLPSPKSNWKYTFKTPRNALVSVIKRVAFFCDTRRTAVQAPTWRVSRKKNYVPQ